MNKNGRLVVVAIILVAVIIVGWIAFLFIDDNNNSDIVSEGRTGAFRRDNAQVAQDNLDLFDTTSNSTFETTHENAEADNMGSNKEFSMIARRWEFDPDIIIVNKGDTVKLSIESIDVDHGISLPGFGISERLNAGENVEIEFVADKAGEFNFRCNVACGSGHGGMDGKLIVEG